MRKWIRMILGLMAVCALVYSVRQMVVFGMEARASSALIHDLTAQVVTTRPTASAPEEIPAGEELPPEIYETAPIQVDFETLTQQGNAIGWLYCADTPINLPVAQSDDNSYYLRRLLDGRENNGGTLFADFRCEGDFSGWNTVIYGHNMRNGTMFGSLRRYGDQDYYDEHPVWWLLTPQGDYKVELLAGFLTAATSEFFSFPEDAGEALELANKAVEQSTFRSDFTPAYGDKFLTLSTCSYEFDDARYVLLGRLVPCF